MPTVAVVAGSLLCFDDKVTKQDQNDIINSTLFAQLDADSKSSRTIDNSEWHKSYRSKLEQVGWITDRVTHLQVGHVDIYTNVEQAVLLNRSDLLDDFEVSTLKSALRSLRQRDDAMRLFDNKATGGDSERTTAAFDIGVCSPHATGNLVVKMAYYIFTTSVSMDHVLSSSLSNPRVTFSKCFQLALANQAIFKEVREPIKQKLGDKTQSNVVVFSI